MTVLAALGVLALPREDAVWGAPVRGPEHPQAQHFVASRQRALAVEPPVAHFAAELEPGSGASHGGSERVGIVHTCLDLELVQRSWGAQSKIASRTAAVSARVSNT